MTRWFPLALLVLGLSVGRLPAQDDVADIPSQDLKAGKRFGGEAPQGA